MFHDKKATRLAGSYRVLAKSDLQQMQKIKLRRRTKTYKVPTLSEYLAICKRGEKRAVMELKCDLNDKQFGLFAALIKAEFDTASSVFISFDALALQKLRMHFPDAECHYVCRNFDELTFKILVQNKFDLDILYKNVTPEIIGKCHDAGIKVNCWTVNKKRVVKRLCGMGVDYITTDKDWER